MDAKVKRLPKILVKHRTEFQLRLWCVFFLACLFSPEGFTFPEMCEGGEEERKGYIDTGNGTAEDPSKGLTWIIKDSYKELGAWTNFNKAKELVKTKNKQQFGGFNDWRLPTRKELKSLYNRENRGKLTYDKSETLRVDEIFDFSYCYYWTSEWHNREFVWQVSLCNGRAYKVLPKNEPGNATLLVRPR